MVILLLLDEKCDICLLFLIFAQNIQGRVGFVVEPQTLEEKVHGSNTKTAL